MFENLPKNIADRLNDLMEKGLLTPTLALHMTGMGKKNEQEIIDNIKDDYSQFSPESVPLSADPIRDASDRFLAMTNFSMSTLAGLSPAMRLLNEKLQFTTMPAFSMAQNLVSGYSAMIVSALTEAEQVKYEYGGLMSTLSMGITIHAVMGMLSGSGGRVGGSTVLSKAAQMLSKTAIGRAGAAAANVVMSRVRSLVIFQAFSRAASAVAGLFGKLSWLKWLFGGSGPGGWAAAIGLALLLEGGRYAWHVIGQRAGAKRATALSIQKASVALFDKQKIIDEFVEYQGVFQGIPGYDNKPYELLDSMLENDSYYGVSPSAFGSTYSDARQISNQIASTSDSGEELPEYVSRVMAIQGILGVSDPTTISSTFSNIIRANPNYSADIEEATLAFERFFMALVGDGKIHLSLLGVAQALSDFSLNYAASTKFVLGSENNVARIAKFMNTATSGNRTSAESTIAATQSIDEVLTAGAFGDNWGALNFMQNHGISQFEGVKGVTGDPDTFGKFISGLASDSGVGWDSFDENGGLKDTKQAFTLVRTLTGVFGMEGQGLSAVVAAVRSYVQGNRVTDVHTEYMETRATTTAAIAADNEGYGLKKELVAGDIALSKAIAENADYLNEMGQLLMDAYFDGFPNAMIRAGGLVGEALALVVGNTEYTPTLVPDLPLPFQPFDSRPSGNVNPYGSRNVDTRYFNDNIVSEGARDVLNSMFGAMGAGSTVRVTGVSGRSYSHNPNATNYGFDVAISSGEIYSPFNQDVEVVYVGRRVTRNDGANTYGNSVVFKLPDGSLVSFSHLATPSLLRVGQTLSPDRFIGLQGDTGTRADGSKVVTGPHVDIEVYGPGAEVDGNRILGTIVSNPNEIARLLGRFVGEPTPEYEFTTPDVDTDDNPEYNEDSGDSSSSLMEFNIEISGLHRLEDVAHSIRQAFA